MEVIKSEQLSKDTYTVVLKGDNGLRIEAEWRHGNGKWSVKSYIAVSDTLTAPTTIDRNITVAALSVATAEVLKTFTKPKAPIDPEVKRAKDRAYYRTHKLEMTDEQKAAKKAYFKAYRQAHLETIRERDRKYSKNKYTKEERRKNYLKKHPNAKSMPRLTSEEKASISAMHDQGVSIERIAEALGRCVPTVSRYINTI